MAFSLSKFRKASVGLAGLALVAGCGGGGGSGIDRPAPGYELGQLPNVKTIETPLGTTGSRGSGAAVFLSVVLQDREFNICDAQIEYGFDGNNGGAVDGVITGSDGDPSATDEYSPATPHPTSPIGYNQATNQPELHPWNLESARGKGANHVFVWDSAQDLPGRRYVTQDYVYLNDGWDGTPTGRLEKNSDGTDKLAVFPGLRLRMRINDSAGAELRWSPWTATQAFDLNNNTPPVVTIDATGLNGVVANASGTAADEDVQINFHAYDDDTGIPAGFVDRAAVHVDYAHAQTSFSVLSGSINAGANTITVIGHGLSDGDDVVLLDSTGNTPAGINPEQTYFVKVVTSDAFKITDTFNAVQGVPAGLGEDVDIFNSGTGTHNFGVNFHWAAASVFPGVADTFLDTDTVPLGGVAHSIKWDSVADVGTTNGDYILRITPFDQQSENGATVVMDSWFRLDNFTIFTDAGVSMPTPRVGHRMSTLPDGTVLITGGRESAGGVSVNKVVMFFPSIGQTTLGAMATKAPMGTARAYHTQTRLYDDRLLVAGGFTGASTALSSLELYDPIANTWTPAGVSMATARARHTAVLLANGDVLLAGGVDSAGNPLATAEIYHPDSDTITTVPGGLTAARHSVGGALLPDYRVLIPGGTGAGGASLSSVEMFDPAANAGAGGFTSGTAMPAARRNHTVSNATNGKVVVTGGTGGAGALNTLTVFDPQANSWTNGGNMSAARSSHTGVLMGDGKVLVAGGSSGAAVLATGQMYDPATNSYDALNGVMVEARADAESSVLNNGRVLIVGGVNGAGQPIDGIEIFTPDEGFNYVPTARAGTPEEPQSYLYGAVIPVRLLDSEEDRVRFIALYSYFDIGTSQYTAWKSCTPAGGPYGDGIPDTIGDDYSDGVVHLESTDTDLPLPINPSQDNTGGDEADHPFVWAIASDLPVKQDYDLVKVRFIPFGAAQGTAGTTFAFKIVSNTRVIPRLYPFTPNVSGTVQIDYHLMDIDGGANGDPARVEFQYAIDLNGDGQILDTSDETWEFCTEGPGGDGSGAGYTLQTSSNYSTPPTTDADGWHTFMWDSLRDIGSPDPDDTDPTNDLFNDPAYTAAQGNKKILLRLIPYDDPLAGGPTTETKGFVLNFGAAEGLIIERDPNGLYLEKWETESGTQYAGTMIGNVKIDEHLIFTFHRNVEPSSVTNNSISIKSGGRQILGAFDVVGNVVTFYPQLNNVSNGVLVYNGTENPTVLTRGVQVTINIPGFAPGTNPETTDILRVENSEWTSGDAAAGIAIVHGNAHSPAFQTIAPPSLGAAAYHFRGISPTATSATPVLGATGQGTTGWTLTFELDHPVSPDSCTIANLRFVVDLNQDGVANTNDSVVPGTWTVVNTAGPAGTAKAVVTFTPLVGVTMPTDARIMASFASVTAGDGTATLGEFGGTPVTYFQTGGTSTPTTTPFSESFTDSVNKDTAPGMTNALWNVAPYSGMLTGNRDGGSGVDGVANNGVVAPGTYTFSAKNDWNFTTFNLPKNQVWRFTGTASNLPVTIRSTGAIDIYGILDVAGGSHVGQFGFSAYAISTSTSYGQKSTSLPSSGAVMFPGGVGIAGGGAGGNQRNFQQGLSGTAGNGAPSGATPNNGYGYGGAAYSSSYGVGGGGGGHAQAGQGGGSYQSTYKTSPNYLGGIAYNTAAVPTLMGGSGGGAGSSWYSYYTATDESYHGSGSQTTYYFFVPGGAGGAGGGAVKFACNGAFNLHGAGLIDASGGDGGEVYGYSSIGGGGGGGGSGGTVHIVSGGDAVLSGMIDVRGGLGGDQYPYRVYSQGSPLRWGQFGGDGASGRVRIDAPNVTGTQVKFLGGAQINTIATSNGGALSGGTGALNAFPGSSSTTINLDSYTRDANGFYNFTSMNIPVGITVNLTGSYPAKMRFTGSVTINGTLTSNGRNGPPGQYLSGTAPTYTPAAGNNGSGAGGVPNPTGTTTAVNATNGIGTGPSATGGGFGGQRGGQPNAWTSGSYSYWYGGSGGGGGANRLNAPTTAALGIYGGNAGNLDVRSMKGGFQHMYTGYYAASTNGGNPGVGGVDPELVTMATLVGGSGGGGGGNGVYGLTSGSKNFYGGTGGGSGGGAIGIETVGVFTMGAAGSIDVIGGAGGSYGYTSVNSAGGGGSGGTVLIRANSLSLTAGASMSLIGGNGGKGYNAGTNYGQYAGDGGVGGPGVARIEATTLPNFLNTGGILGFTATTGSLAVNTYVGGGPLGTMNYQTAAGLAPDFHTTGISVAPSNTFKNTQGNVALNLQGQMRDPITGNPSTTLIGTQNLMTNPLTFGLGAPDAIDGYYRWRFQYVLSPPNAGNPNAPEIYDVAIKVDTK